MSFRSLDPVYSDKVWFYGDTISKMFNPGEAVIWKFSKTRDTTIPTVYCLKNVGHNLISIEFNTKIILKNLVVEIADLKILETELLADLRTV